MGPWTQHPVVNLFHQPRCVFVKRLCSPPRLWLTQTAQCHWFLLLSRLLIIARSECNISAAEESKTELSHAALTDRLPEAPDDSFKPARSLLARLAVTLADVRAWFQLNGKGRGQRKKTDKCIYRTYDAADERCEGAKVEMSWTPSPSDRHTDALLLFSHSVFFFCFFIYNSNIFDPGLSKCPPQITHIYSSAIYVTF